ncbi:MAG: vWA domain-containing protein [Candidatus Chromulinivorax sp.]
MKMFSITWAANSVYYLYGIIPFILLLIWQYIKKNQQRKLLVNDLFVPVLLKNYSWNKKVIKLLLMIFGMLFLLLAFLRPQWGKQEQMVSQEGRDLIIALDISRSMLAQDVKPNRLAFAQEKIKKLLYNLSCERVGLIVFSGSTVVSCPLTTDYSAFFLFLDQLDIDMISQGTTSIDQALRAGLQIFESIPTRQTKLLVLLTDGEDFSTDLQGIKQKVQDEHLSVFTIGIGTTHGAPIPVLDKDHNQIGWEKDDQGNIVMSRLNDHLLADIAIQSGGRYLHAQESDDDIAALIACINKFEKDKLEDKTLQALQEQYPYCIALSLVCFGLEWIL